MATSVIRINNVSGTSHTIDVSALELDPNTTIKDFLVSHNGIDKTSLYTKTSATLITYSGATVTLGTLVNVERDTSLVPSETSFLSVTTAAELTNALDKLRRRVEEADAYATLMASLLQQNGITVGTIPILNNAYGASWASDNVQGATRAAIYGKMNSMDTLKAPLASPVFTGAPLVPTPGFGVLDTQAINRTYASTMIQGIASEAYPAINLNTSSQLMQTVNFTTAAGGCRFMFLMYFGRIYNGNPNPSVVEYTVKLDGVAIATSITHSHASGAATEQTSFCIPIIRSNIAAGAHTLTAEIKAFTTTTGRVDQSTFAGFLVY